MPPGTTTGRATKKIGESRVVYFHESNRWIRMEEPAWYVYQHLENGYDPQHIAGMLTEKYNLPATEALRFATEVKAAVRDHSAPVQLPPRTAGRPSATVKTPAPHSIRHYIANGKRITISYGSPLLEYYVHRPLAHLEVEPSANYDTLLEVFGTEKDDSPSGDEKIAPSGDEKIAPFGDEKIAPSGDEKIAPFGDEKIAPSGDEKIAPFGDEKVAPPGEERYFLKMGERLFGFGEAGLIKRELFIGLANLIYGKSDGDWMAFIHASAVTDGQEALLLSSASGSGKSTMAALLQSEPAENPTDGTVSGTTPHNAPATGKPADSGSLPGLLYFMSDDFVPVDTTAKKAHCFPAAITIKEGSFPVISPLYDRSDDADASYRGPGNRSVRYLKPRFHDAAQWEPRAVKKIVFIKYDPAKEVEIKRLDTLTALALFHEEAWVSHDPVHAQSFIDWFARLECYRLRYSDNTKGVNAIRSLFDN